MLSKLKKSWVGQWLKKSWIYKLYERSQLDWRYPYISLGWRLAGILVPRRKLSVDGVFFTLSCTNWITHFRWYLFKKKEVEVRNYINTYINEGDIFFDIGANVGIYTVYCGKRYKDISIYSFEPEYSNLHLLKENVICNNLFDKVKIFSTAISDFVGISSLHLQDITPGSAVHTESKKDIKRTDEGYPVIWSEGIMSITIDYICEQLGIIPNCIKIDTDGNEEKILKGATKTLKNKNLKSLILEVPYNNPVKKNYCYKILKSSGFYQDWSDPLKTRNEIWIKKK